MRRLVFLTLIVLMSSAAAIPPPPGPETRAELLSMCDKELGSMGYQTEKMSVSFDTYNSQWESYRKASGLETPEHLVGRSKGDYWAVYFAPWKPQLGGDVWIFVSKKQRRILGVLKGQ